MFSACYLRATRVNAIEARLFGRFTGHRVVLLPDHCPVIHTFCLSRVNLYLSCVRGLLLTTALFLQEKQSGTEEQTVTPFIRVFAVVKLDPPR